MDKFSAVKRSRPSQTMAGMQSWVENFVCRPHAKQNVVGRRTNEFGTKVTQVMVDNSSRWAHVCPFVRDAIDYDVFYIEESQLSESEGNQIEQLLRKQRVDFKDADPAFDPIKSGKAKMPTLLKTFLTFFPRVKHRSRQKFPLFDDLHSKLKPEFIKEGLMLGQFYAGCPEPAIYNALWTGPLASPYAAFAIRYMAQHDHLFIAKETEDYKSYEQFFPEGHVL